MKAVPVSRYIVFFSIAVVGCLIDLATKSWIFDRLGMPGGRVEWIWQDVLGFETSLNKGALFGLGQGWVTAFTVLSVVAAVGVFYWLFFAGAARQWSLTVALGCVSAGIFGNLYDRLGMPGLKWNFADPPHHRVGDSVFAVRDWILVMIGRFHWPNFNVADSLLVCGAVIIVWHAFWYDDRRGEAVGRQGQETAQTERAGGT